MFNFKMISLWENLHGRKKKAFQWRSTLNKAAAVAKQWHGSEVELTQEPAAD
jgi:hypothetical protein